MGRVTRRLPVFTVVLAGLVLAGSATEACSSTTQNGVPAGDGGDPEGGTGRDASDDGSSPDPDAGSTDAAVDAPRDANLRDANGPGAAGANCIFNVDCQSALRCECNEQTGCACKAGPRGTGKNGIDPCTTGEECASSLCIEGTPAKSFFCSDECASSADCVGQLPMCTSLTGVGMVCVRATPK